MDNKILGIQNHLLQQELVNSDPKDSEHVGECAGVPVHPVPTDLADHPQQPTRC